VSSTAQHMAALEKANGVKAGRRELRRALAAAELSLPAALVDPRAQSMPIHLLLCAQYGWGPDRVWKALSLAGRLLWPDAIDPPPLASHTRVGALTERERLAIVQACGGRS
jgi:hypothetical protein